MFTESQAPCLNWGSCFRCMDSGKWSAGSRSGLFADRLGLEETVSCGHAGSLVCRFPGSWVGKDFWGLTAGRSMIGFAAAAWVLLDRALYI